MWPDRDLGTHVRAIAHSCAAARFISATSILLIFSMAFMARLARAGSLSPSNSPSALGMICHDNPNLIFQPAAAVGLAAGGKLFPQLVDFFLRRSIDEERNRRRELEHRAAVQRHELLALQLKGRRHDRSLRPRASVAVARNFADF
jgi:hypothetical protein